jgi:hypothetical protein
VNEELAFGACRGEDIGSKRVELQCLDRTGVLVDLLYLSVAVGGQYFSLGRAVL